MPYIPAIKIIITLLIIEIILHVLEILVDFNIISL
jgi:hypothetical protein